MTSKFTVYLDTLGCEKNQVDSEGALGLLLQRGFRVVDTPKGADLLVVNTCGFLASARTESLERIRELAAVKGHGKLVAMGCFVQGGTHDLRKLVPGVDHLLGVGQYHRLAELLEGAEDGPVGSPDAAPYSGYGARARLGSSHVAYLKLAEGCNQSCTFCKIPLLRGRQRSRPVQAVVAEAASLVEQGTTELVLIAQNSSAYGIDLPGQPRLGDVCRALSVLDGLRWIRVMYAYPPMFTTKLAEDVYSVDEVVSYLDIPIQHASARVLDGMNRGYDPARLLRQIGHLRVLRPDIMLRTTALVGFPGETEDDVVQLLDFLADVGFDHVATFAYSHEAGTPAYALDDDVDAQEKEDRRARVEDLQWDIGVQRKEAWLGRQVEIVIDEILDETERDRLSGVPIEAGEDSRVRWPGLVAFGRSEGFCPEIDGGVWLPADGLEIGSWLKVTLQACGPYDFLATAIGAGRSPSEREL